MLIDKIKSKTKIIKGWSDDQKYCASTSDGKKYLLRISNEDKLHKKKVEFEMMQKVDELRVPMCRPIEFGTCAEGVYSIQSWIEGSELEEVLDGLSDKEKYDYGYEAGEILKKIHSIKAPDTQEEWDIRFNYKIDKKIKEYMECPIKYDGGQAFIDYIESNRGLLKNRPQCYQHGDYHLGNMMIDSEGKLMIIDFDRDDFGDPWEEFNRIVWCAQISPDFATGMVDGYFNGDVPIEFWKLLALYIANNSLSSLPWAIKFGQSEIDTMTKQAKEILSWYDDMKNPVPTWYTMKIKYPDYNNSIVSLICSVLKYYEVESNHGTLEVFDNYLKKDYKNVVVVLLDGLGVDVLEKHLEETDFLRRHFVTGISTVFPPTTTAAVTSIESGLTPMEHGWNLYFKELDKIINAFINTVSGSGEQAADYHVAQRVLPYKTVYQKINEVGNARAYSVSPFGTNKVSNIDEMFSELERLCGVDEKKYIFAYSQQPDKDMHEYGCYSCEASSWIKKLDKRIENMCKNLEDTIVIITADHGHIDLKHKFISDYPQLLNMMIRPISIESRAACFHVKEE